MGWALVLLLACIVLAVSSSSPCTTAVPQPPASPCTTAAPAPPASPCTTAAPPTCTSFACPAGWVKRPQAHNLQGQLSAKLCCLHPTTTPCTTTTHLTCSSFTCPPAPWTKVPGDPVCAAIGCTKELCCVCLTTTPCTTTTPTCTTFQCPAGWVERPQAYSLH